MAAKNGFQTAMHASHEPKPSTSICKLPQPLRLLQARYELETDNAFAAAAQNFEKSRLHRKVADSETTFDLLFAQGHVITLPTSCRVL